jgi:DNA-binding SARP family transcriptional activator
MDFHILGPIEVLDEGRVVALGGSRQRALLALMLLHANETLSTDRLIDELWGEDATDGARRTVHVQISRLRKAITPAGGLREEREGTVVTRERGYELIVDPERLDAHRFERLLAECGQCLETGEFERAADGLQRALALWRGAPLSDVAYERFAQSEIQRLNELRAAALEQQIEADLALGRHADVVGRLPALIREHPYRERLRGQLMLALYRCDRQADALQAYQDARRDLVQGLGIEPGKRLRELEAAILAQDPQLSPAPPTRSPPREEAAAPTVTRARRLVTVVVVNVAGSAALAARLDPESMHDVLTRRAAVCTDVVERHGGTIERFAGDLVVGTFGLRSLHEDDGLRAVRAALELQGALVELGTVTVGINTGDVFVGPGNRGETFAMGDTMHVAARLDESAGDGEILLGESTHLLVSDHVIAEPLPPLVVRGREAGVSAYRLLGLRAEPTSRSAGSPFVNRDRERAALRELLTRASAERSCRQVTVVGPAGIGKSRLAFELIREVRSEEKVVVGTCLSYGTGITFRPVADIVHQLTGGELESGVARLLEGEDEAELITRRVLGAIGTPDESTPAVETFWAVRRLFEAAAREQPLVAIVDDIQWAEPMLLDLLESVVAFSSGSPIALVCLARPELLEKRPSWAALQPSGSLLELEPLTAADAREFVETLAAGELDPRSANRIVKRAEGNPLFLEQLVAVRADQDPAGLPHTIEALLASRIERLEPDERNVLIHASVEGRGFHRAAVAELLSTGDPHAIDAPLMGLVRKQLVRPDRPELVGEDAFRFAHTLIREVAYSGMPKRQRADLHERLAGWLKEREHVPDEIVGFHLESAVRHRRAIGVEVADDLAAEAADRLATAARAALARGDSAAGASLLERAVGMLEPDDPARPELLASLCAALIDAGRLADADTFLSEAIARAVAEGDTRLESRALVDQQLVRLHAGTSGGHEQARRTAASALEHLERHDDDLGQCRAWRLTAWIDWIECLTARADAAWQRAEEHARRAGEDREVFDILCWRASGTVFGPMPVEAAIERCLEIREQVRTSPVAVAITLHPLALLHAMRGDFDVARRLILEGNEILDELGRMESAVSHHEAIVEMLAGRPDEAERRLRPGYDKLDEMGERDLRATTAGYLARAVYAQDRLSEAEELCRTSERIAEPEDIATQVLWRGVLARIRARRREFDEALALGREAVRLAEPTDLIVMRGGALLDLAEVVALTDHWTDAQALARQALELFELKGNVVLAARARSWLEAGNGSGKTLATVPRP